MDSYSAAYAGRTALRALQSRAEGPESTQDLHASSSRTEDLLTAASALLQHMNHEASHELSKGSVGELQRHVDVLTTKLCQLEKKLVDGLQEHHYVHQHNAMVLTQLSNRLAALEAARGSPDDVPCTTRELAVLKDELQHIQMAHTDKLAQQQQVLETSTHHLHTWSQQFHQVVKAGIADLQKEVATCKSNMCTPAQVQAQLETAIRCLPKPAPPQPSQEANLLACVTAQSELLQRVERLESQKFVSRHDAQRMYQYVNMMGSMHSSMQAAVAQLQSMWPRVCTSLLTAKDVVGCGELPGRAAAAVAAAHEVSQQAQQVVDLLTVHLKRGQQISAVAHEKFGGMLKDSDGAAQLTQQAAVIGTISPPPGPQGAAEASHVIQSTVDEMTSLNQLLARKLEQLSVSSAAEQRPLAQAKPDAAGPQEHVTYTAWTDTFDRSPSRDQDKAAGTQVANSSLHKQVSHHSGFEPAKPVLHPKLQQMVQQLKQYRSTN